MANNGTFKVKAVKLNRAGVGQLLKTGCTPALIAAAKDISNRAGDGYDVYVGRTRQNVSVGVRSTTKEADRDARDNHTLHKQSRRRKG